MKIASCDLEKFAGKKVYFSEEGRVDSDLYQVYFTTAAEAISEGVNVINAAGSIGKFDPKKYTVTALYGTVDEEGVIDDSTANEIPGWEREYINALVNLNRDNAVEVMQDAERAAMINTGCEYRVYIDTEGDIDYEEWPAGDRAFHPCNNRYYIKTICYRNFDIVWDYMFTCNGDIEAFYSEHFNIEVDMSEVCDSDGYEVEGFQEKFFAIAATNGIGDNDLENAIDNEADYIARDLATNEDTLESINDALEDFLSRSEED